MNCLLMYVRIRSLFVILSLTVANDSIQAAEDNQRDAPLPPSRILFEAKLPSDRCQNYTEKADCLVFQFKVNSIQANPRLLQTPQYDIDLSENSVTPTHLKDLIPIAAQLVRLKLKQSGADNCCFPLLAQLTSLTDLDLTANQFDNGAIAFLTTLVNLRSLRVDYNKLSHPIVEALPSLQYLETLCLNGNHLGNLGILSLSSITSLRNLEVISCGFDHTILPNFLLLPQLRTLDVSYNAYMETNHVETFLKQAQEKDIKVKSYKKRQLPTLKNPRDDITS